MKTFKFIAKQGQESLVCRLLTAHYGKPRVLRNENGVVITLGLPKNVSKRQVNQMLFANNVPGVHDKSNKLKVVKGEYCDILYRDTYDTDPFIWVNEDGEFQGKYQRVYVDYGCTCCGGQHELQKI